MVTDVREAHSRKAYLPIEVTEFGMITDVRKAQSPKASSPIEVTESGISMVFSDVQP